ncbi:MAG: ExbD/TolR family protein [bacterium]
MHIPTRKRVKTTELNMTPMIDVVFLLITFFMVVTEITRQDEIEDLELPDVKADKVDENPDPERLVINVLADGTYIIAGREVGEKDVFDALAVEARLSRKKGTEVSNRTVLVKADKRTPYRFIERIMQMCTHNKIRIWRLAFGTRPTRPGGGEKRAEDSG